MTDMDGDLKRRLDAVVERLSASRRTFTEPEALAEIWDAGYEVSPQLDARFVIAREADHVSQRHWRLASQSVANNRLLDALTDGSWDGRDLDAELARLDAEDGVYYIFCPVDPRFSVRADGTVEPADREREVPVPAEARAELDTLAPALLDQWRAAGGRPWILRQITEALGALAWPGASQRVAHDLVRAWLCGWPEVARVGRDYWVVADQLPHGPNRTRLQVVRIAEPSIEAGVVSESGAMENDGASSGLSGGRGILRSGGDIVLPGSAPTAAMATWTTALRTVHLVEGFLPVPAGARGAYPPRAPGGGRWEVLRAKWFETNEDLWVWLERERDLLCGPDLAEKLAWCDAGQRLEVRWAPDVLVLRTLGIDTEVQREETRLVDAEALAAVRGGLSESYRRSLQAILAGAPEGLTFPELVAALRARQNHEVHRGTVRAILNTGGFRIRDGRWFAAPEGEVGERRLRRVLVEALVAGEEGNETTGRSVDRRDAAALRDIARAVEARLKELIATLGAGSEGGPAT